MQPIPLELLIFSTNQEGISKDNHHMARNTSVLNTATEYVITLTHLGRYGSTLSLSVGSSAQLENWSKDIALQIGRLTKSKRRFEVEKIKTPNFSSTMKVNCSCIYKDRLVLGTDSGLFVESGHSFSNVLQVEKILQIGILEHYNMLLILSERLLLQFSLNVLDGESVDETQGKKVSSNVTFFKQGVCLDHLLVCAVRSAQLTSRLKVYEPVGLGVSNRKGKMGRLFNPHNEALNVFKELFIPAETKSLHFMTNSLCVGSVKGFELVDLATSKLQSLLDEKDKSLEFAMKKESLKPLGLFKLDEEEFLVCFSGIKGLN
jgi:hypothetical protein